MTLPAELTAHLTAKEHLMLPTFATAMNYIRTSAVLTHRTPNALLSLHAQGVAYTPFIPPLPPASGDKKKPLYMNRPDGLVSAPPWANNGQGWPGNATLDRAALWQRNNPR